MNSNKIFNGRKTPEEKWKQILDQEGEDSPLTTFAEYLEKVSRAAKATQVKTLAHLRRILHYTKAPPQEWKEETVKQIAAVITGKLRDPSNTLHTYAQSSQYLLLGVLRRYASWLRTTDLTTHLQTIPQISRNKQMPITRVTATDIISEERVTHYIDAASHSRDKAFIALTYYGALRIHETASLRWGDITESGEDLIIRTTGKEGILREIPIPKKKLKNCLDAWKQERYGTQKPPKEEVVFTTRNPTTQDARPVTYTGMVKALRAAVGRAGEEPKAFRPHLLRHSRITQLVTTGVPEYAIAMIAWGTPKSPMMKRYTHPSLEDVARAIRER